MVYDPDPSFNKEVSTTSHAADTCEEIGEDNDWSGPELLKYVTIDKKGFSNGIRECAPQWVKDEYEKDVKEGKAPVFICYW